MIKKIVFLICIFTFVLNASNLTAIMKTSKGDIELELRPDLAPLAVENFVKHSKDGYYNGQIFHRVIKNFMIQAGDPTGSGSGGESIWKKEFKDEFSKNAIFDKPGILAMANKGPNTNGSQFFITTTSAYWLNGYHTIFGYVKNGFDTVKRIENVQTNGKNRGNKPIEDVKILSIEIKE